MYQVDDLIEQLRPVDWDGANFPFGAHTRSRVRLFLFLAEPRVSLDPAALDALDAGDS